MRDTLGRTIDYMRISITDRCNLRCRYCMPEGVELVPMSDILTFEEIVRIAVAAAEAGIRKFKVTGGEPLVRLGCPELVKELKRIPGVEQVTLTTNGVLLSRYLDDLVRAGLDGVNISLDTLDRQTYKKITGRDELQEVLEGINLAVKKGIPAKLNCVLQKGLNDHEWKNLIRFAGERPMDIRFIELMPIGFGKKFEAVYNEELLEKLQALYPGIKPDGQVHGNGPAVYYRLPGAKGSVGFISAMHGKFCAHCNRLRLTSQGMLKPCLCFEDFVDIGRLVREKDIDTGEIDKQIQEAIRKAVAMKPECHRFEAPDEVTEQKRMIEIGG